MPVAGTRNILPVSFLVKSNIKEQIPVPHPEMTSRKVKMTPSTSPSAESNVITNIKRFLLSSSRVPGGYVTFLTMPSFKIQDAVAFVTGTSKTNGIGRAVVEALLTNGASKVYATARNVSQLNDFVAQHNGKVVAVELDLTDLDSIEKLGEVYSDVTLVVNNAGYLSGSSSIGDIGEIKTELAVNYLAPLAIGKAFSKVFTNVVSSESEIKPTAFVNVMSIVAFVNSPITPTYSASKAACHSLTQAQRRDFSNSLVIGVYPGPIDTAMADGFHMDKTPPSSVARAIVDALRTGNEDVFPDPKSIRLHDIWQKDAKALERQMATFTA